MSPRKDFEHYLSCLTSSMPHCGVPKCEDSTTCGKFVAVLISSCFIRLICYCTLVFRPLKEVVSELFYNTKPDLIFSIARIHHRTALNSCTICAQSYQSKLYESIRRSCDGSVFCIYGRHSNMDSSQRGFFYNGDALWCKRRKFDLSFSCFDSDGWIRRNDAIHHLSHGRRNAPSLCRRCGDHEHGRI
jgi:hypothetical protein